MPGSKYPLIAREGWLFIALTLLLLFLAYKSQSVIAVLLAAALLVFFVLLFRDPPREIPSRPLAVLSPVDGEVTEVRPTDKGYLVGEAFRITIQIDNMGAYTARSPTEGKVLNLRDNVSQGSRLLGASGLWVRTDEGDDVVLLLRGPKLLGRPASFIRYGERIGQGQRCAYLRIAHQAEVYLPLSSRVNVEVGSKVRAGADVLATLVHK